MPRAETQGLGIGPLGFFFTLALPIVAAALFYVWTHVTTVHLGYSLSTQSQLHQKYLEKNRGLRVEVAALRAPERLKGLASRYELRPLRAEQVVRLTAPLLAQKGEQP